MALGVNLASWYMPYTQGVASAIDAWSNYAASEEEDNRKLAAALYASTVGVGASALFTGGPAASSVRAAADLGDFTEGNNASARSALARQWILGVSFGLQGRNLVKAVMLTQHGYNPLVVVEQAAGLRPEGIKFSDPNPEGLRAQFMNFPVVPSYPDEN
jgi:hypothetical protein